MGAVCKSAKNSLSTSTSPKVGFDYASQANFFPPPNLLRKSSQSPVIKEKNDLFQCVSGMELNRILEGGGNIESNLSLFIIQERVQIEKINKTNILLLNQIMKERDNLNNYNERGLLEKIFRDYNSIVFEKYHDMIKDETVWARAENNFCTNILFNATEIYQVLLSFKKTGKKKKNMNFWWLPPLVNFSDSYDESDCYSFMRKKFICLEKQIRMLFTNTLADAAESQPIKKENNSMKNDRDLDKKESETLDVSETHQAMKCQGYNIRKTPVAVIIK